MLETISITTNTSAQKKSINLESDMDFTVDEYHNERIDYHMKMLNYYLNEDQNEKLAARNRLIPGNIRRS